MNMRPNPLPIRRVFPALLRLAGILCLLAAALPVYAANSKSTAPSTLEDWEARIRRAEERYGEVWSARIDSLETGQTIYAYEADRDLIPASNRKLNSLATRESANTF